MKNREKSLIVLISVASWLAVSNYFHQATVLKHLDSVFLFESSMSILRSGQPTSATVTSWPEALLTFTTPAEKLCQADLQRKAATHYNVLNNHAYTALYPLSLLTAVVGPEWAFALANASAYLLLLLLPFLFLRWQGVELFPCLVFVGCVALYPGWSYSAVGDYYMDKLYMPFALASLFLMHTILARLEQQLEIDKRWLLSYTALLIAAALFTERCAIMVILQIGFFLIFYPAVHRAAGLRNVMLGVFVLLGAYLWFYFKFVFSGIEAGGSLLGNSLPALLAPLSRLRQPAMIPFVFVNLLFLGVFVPWAGLRYVLLVVLTMMPNFVTSVGGAELNGWSTHYHAMYMPFLIFAACIGYLRLMQRLKTKTARFGLPALVGAYALLLASLVNPWNFKFDDQPFISAGRGLPAQLADYYLQSTKDVLYRWIPISYLAPVATTTKTWGGVAQSLNATIPQGAKVSLTEAVMPALYKNRNLSYYPIDLDNADYLVIGGTAHDGQPLTINGATSYLGQAESNALNQCLLQRINAKGFTLAQALSGGVLVFERKKNAKID